MEASPFPETVCFTISSGGRNCFNTLSSALSSIGFARNPLNPLFKKVSLAPPTALAVRAIIGSFLKYSSSLLRIIPVASIPSISGIIWSINTRSKSLEFSTRIASLPLSTVSTCILYGCNSPTATSRLIRLSSTISILALGAINVMELALDALISIIIDSLLNIPASGSS